VPAQAVGAMAQAVAQAQAAGMRPRGRCQ